MAATEEFPVELSLTNSATTSPQARREFLLDYTWTDSPAKYLEWLWKDPINFVTRPVFWGVAGWRMLGLEAAAVGALLPADDVVRDIFQDNRSQHFIDSLDPIRNYYTGDMLELYGAGLFAAGLAVRNQRLADSGFLAVESVYYSSQLAGVLKMLSNRERPVAAQNQYEFNGPSGSTHKKSSSFVSGEVAGAFAFSASVSEVWQSPWITWPGYALAGTVALQRMETNAHWLTDCMAAGLLGHAVGKNLVRFHYHHDLEGRLVPFVSRDAVGLKVTMTF